METIKKEDTQTPLNYFSSPEGRRPALELRVTKSEVLNRRNVSVLEGQIIGNKAHKQIGGDENPVESIYFSSEGEEKL